MSDAPLATDARIIAVGDILREARLAVGLTVSNVASKLNLTAQAVEAIEANQFERLPGTTFARGYIRSYAKVLGLDSNQLAQQFDQQVVSNSPVSMVQSIDRVGEARRISRGMLQFSLFVVFLIIIGVAYYAWQTFNAVAPEASNKAAVFDRVEVERADGSMHVQTLDELEDQAVAYALETQVNDEIDVAELSETNTEQEQTEELAVDVEVEQAAVQLEQAVEQSTVENASAQDLQTVAQLAPGMGALQLSFKNDCWLRIVDADGKEINSGLKRAGEQLNVTGKAPLDVHLGYAKGVSIIYNGEPVDFSSSVRGEVARIKLGQ